jgi:nucleotide-binding universal stress UspA family protein
MSDRISRVVVPLDGSGGAELALGPAAEMARAFSAVIVLMRATEVAGPVLGAGVPMMRAPGAAAELGSLTMVPITDPGADMLPAPEDTEATGYIHIRAQELRERGLTVVEDVQPGDPVEGVIEQARLHEGSLIVIAGHWRSGIGRLFFGSTADDIIQRAPCPVLFIRRDDEER